MATCTHLCTTHQRNATFPVGDKARESEPLMRLIRTARYVIHGTPFPRLLSIFSHTLACSECLDAAIAICGPDMPYAEIGRVIEPIAKANGCCVVKEYTGHGIGRVFHGPPPIYHYPTKKVCCVATGPDTNNNSVVWHNATWTCTSYQYEMPLLFLTQIFTYGVFHCY